MAATTKPSITPRQLQAAARAAWKLDAFLERCNGAGLLNLMAFDLDYLADQFMRAAKRLDTEQETP